MSKSHSDLNKDQQLFQAIQTEGSRALEELYLYYRDDFIAFAHRYQAEKDDILDVFQDAIIALFENIQNGTLTSLSSSLKTYLFSIGKYKLIDKLRRSGKEIQTESFDDIDEPLENTYDERMELTHRQMQLKEAINKLGGQCKDLLILFYYRQYSIEAIQHEMEYKNANVVKAHKSRCMKSLRAIIIKKDIL